MIVQVQIVGVGDNPDYESMVLFIFPSNGSK